MVVDGFLIEYFANPLHCLKEYMENNHKERKRTDARMFVIGKILFDKNGEVEELRQTARKQMKRKFESLTKFKLELTKYFLWDGMDNLKDLFSQESPNLNFAYYLFLNEIIKTYATFLRVEVAVSAKIYKFFTDNKFRNKYKIEKFPDGVFVKKTIDCMKKIELENIQELNDYVLKKMGGFEIDGWKMRSKISN